MNNDKYFFINWEDSEKNSYRVGILAEIDNVFYLKTYDKKDNNERDAYSHGYAGLPGFIPGQLYKSQNKLFDFFLNRIFIDRSKDREFDAMEELRKTLGKTLTDSFFIEEVPEIYRERFKDILLAIDSEKQKVSMAKKVFVGPDK